MAFQTEMQRLSIIAGIVANDGHRVVTSIDKPEGHCGGVNFGLDAGGAYIELFGHRMSEDEARTLVANLMNGLWHVNYLSWNQEHFRDKAGANPE